MDSTESLSHAETRIRAGQSVRVVIWLVVLGALVVFGALNTDKVKIDWTFVGAGSHGSD